jgi:hypothetical protein
VMLSDLLANAMMRKSLSPYCWVKIAASPIGLATTMIWDGMFVLKYARTGSLANSSLMELTDASQSTVHWNVASFFVSSRRGAVMSAKPGMNRRT